MSDMDVNRIFLCGFMATGKTTLGKQVARNLEWPFIDLDDVIVRRSRLSISQIFDLYGEEHFRKLERENLQFVLENYEGIIALGGGALQNQEYLEYIKENGFLVFLKTPLENLWPRLLRKKSRPLLRDRDGHIKKEAQIKEDLTELYEKRLPLYEQAHLIFEAQEGASPVEQGKLLMEEIEAHASA